MNFSRKNERVPVCKSQQGYKYGTNTLIQGHFSRGVPSGAVAIRGPSDLPPPHGWLNWAWWGHLSHMLQRNQTMAGFWGLAWWCRVGGPNRGEDGHVSQASCASGEGQLEGVENQPFPPPEGAPEDSSSNWQTSPGICPMALAKVPWGNAKKQSWLIWRSGGGGQGREKLFSQMLKSMKTSGKWSVWLSISQNKRIIFLDLVGKPLFSPAQALRPNPAASGLFLRIGSSPGY